MLVGGQIINVEAITRYPGFPEPTMGSDLAALVEQQAVAAGAEFVFGAVDVLAVDDAAHTVSVDGGVIVAPAVVLATGSRLRRLGIDGEERLLGRGVSYCGSCDGPLFAGQRVAVVGGGDSAADEALALAEHASATLMLVREDALHAAAATQLRVLEHPGISVRHGVEPEEILGDEQVERLRLRDTRDGVRSELDVAGVFVYAGLQPNTELVRDIVDCDDDGRVRTSAWMETDVPGIFAAGDLRVDSPRQLVNAASDGATAAIAAHRFLTAR
jgi:thioredoxin reductase (NADPH)